MKIAGSLPIKLGHFFLSCFPNITAMVSKGPDYQCLLKPLSETWLVQRKPMFMSLAILTTDFKLATLIGGHVGKTNPRCRTVRRCTLMFLGVRYKIQAPILHVGIEILLSLPN